VDEGGVKIEVKGSTVESVDELLARLFWKEPELAGKAGQFLGFIREWARSESPFRVSRWQQACERLDLTQSQYHNILRRLRRAGLVEKRYNKVAGDHELFLSDGFAGELASFGRAWSDFTAK